MKSPEMTFGSFFRAQIVPSVSETFHYSVISVFIRKSKDHFDKVW